MDPRTRQVKEVMQTQVATLGPKEHLDLADDIMRLGRVRHMPVVEGERLVGIVSQRDLLAASLTRVLEFDPEERRNFLRAVQVDEVMTRDPVSVTPESTLREAAALLLGRRVGCLPVVDADGLLVGLLSEVDLIEAAFIAETS